MLTILWALNRATKEMHRKKVANPHHNFTGTVAMHTTNQQEWQNIQQDKIRSTLHYLLFLRNLACKRDSYPKLLPPLAIFSCGNQTQTMHFQYLQFSTTQLNIVFYNWPLFYTTISCYSYCINTLYNIQSPISTCLYFSAIS